MHYPGKFLFSIFAFLLSVSLSLSLSSRFFSMPPFLVHVVSGLSCNYLPDFYLAHEGWLERNNKKAREELFIWIKPRIPSFGNYRGKGGPEGCFPKLCKKELV